MRQLDALDVLLQARQGRREVPPDPVALLGVPVRQPAVVRVRASHVRREGVVEAGRLDGDELVVLLFEGDWGT